MGPRGACMPLKDNMFQIQGVFVEPHENHRVRRQQNYPTGPPPLNRVQPGPGETIPMPRASTTIPQAAFVPQNQAQIAQQRPQSSSGFAQRPNQNPGYEGDVSVPPPPSSNQGSQNIVSSPQSHLPSNSGFSLQTQFPSSQNPVPLSSQGSTPQTSFPPSQGQLPLSPSQGQGFQGSFPSSHGQRPQVPLPPLQSSEPQAPPPSHQGQAPQDPLPSSQGQGSQGLLPSSQGQGSQGLLPSSRDQESQEPLQSHQGQGSQGPSPPQGQTPQGPFSPQGQTQQVPFPPPQGQTFQGPFPPPQSQIPQGPLPSPQGPFLSQGQAPQQPFPQDPNNFNPSQNFGRIPNFGPVPQQQNLQPNNQQGFLQNLVPGDFNQQLPQNQGPIPPPGFGQPGQEKLNQNPFGQETNQVQGNFPGASAFQSRFPNLGVLVGDASGQGQASRGDMVNGQNISKPIFGNDVSLNDAPNAKYYYPPKQKFPLPRCFYNPSGYVCCNLHLNNLMTQTVTTLMKKPKFNSCNIGAISIAVQKEAERTFGTPFEAITALDDFAQRVHFSGDLVCKIEIDGKVILTYATPYHAEIANDPVNIHEINSFGPEKIIQRQIREVHSIVI
ncbi:hypothetical protein FO519_004683 [Halicephalobus sp. NKZ332]|nr:hypothetical protein FO519_004683 [Halicephalobus sp. NKZ332]